MLKSPWQSAPLPSNDASKIRIRNFRLQIRNRVENRVRGFSTPGKYLIKVGFYDEMEVFGARGSWPRVRFLQDCGMEMWEFAVGREDYVT